ncbi:MAG: Immunity protein SdpI [Elusimicrobia bacterium ADurb.Bin231]|nr:MAG: Immunity protein SdpI [Elusimicrobia bacterium ADurb.Bin231]
MRKTTIIVFVIILLSFVVSAYFYPHMPEEMASHWNVFGEVDGYMPKFWGLFLMPIVLSIIAVLFTFIPEIDPLKENIEKFRKYYDFFIILIFIFILSINLQVILWNLGVEISPNIIVPAGVGILFFYLGILMKNTRRNWHIGIRTPWTLSNERVWEKTHQIGGTLFEIAGIVAVFGALFVRYSLFFIFVPLILIAVCTFIYSYIVYRQEMK